MLQHMGHRTCALQSALCVRAGIWRLFRRGGDDGEGEGKATRAHVSCCFWHAVACATRRLWTSKANSNGL